MATFADIQEEIRNMLDIPDDQLDDEQKAAMNTYLDELAAQEAQKVDSFAQFIKLETEHAEAIKAESKRLAARAKAMENGINSLKNHYVRIMLSNELKKVSGDVYSLSLRKNEKVDAPDTPEGIAALPEIYQRVKTIVEADKAVIKEALKAGLEVPGCKLEQSFSLQVR